MDFKITMINMPNKIKVGEFYQRTRISLKNSHMTTDEELKNI